MALPKACASMECPFVVCYIASNQRHAGQHLCSSSRTAFEPDDSSDSHIVVMSLQIAASAVLLANVALGRPAWTPTLQHYTGYSPCGLVDCCKLMHKLHVGQHSPAAATPAIRDKYAQPRFYCVSAIQSNMEVLPNHMFR